MNVRIFVWYEYNFLIAVLKMREKAISGMMAAVHRRDTDVEEREERISNLNSKLKVYIILIRSHVHAIKWNTMF